MKHFTLGQLLVGALLLGGFLSATATPTVTPLKGKAQDVSPDGLTVVGFYDQEWNEDWTIQFHESFVWDGVNGQQWKTSYDGDDCMESGLFFGVTDTGIITGAVKNDGMRLPANGGGGFKPGLDRQGPEREEELGEPIFTAAVWCDGNLEMLSEGLGSISDYNEPNDGTYAVAASEDGSTVIGYYYKNWMADGAIVWKYNNLCYCFDLVDYAMPDGILSSVMLGISRDGSIIYGNVIKPTPDGGKTVPVYWPSSESCVEIELPKGDYALGCGTAAMSPDGRRILVNGSGYDRMFLGIYNTDTNTLEEIRLPEKTQTVTGYAVTDNGGVFFNVKNKDWESVNYYYSCESGSMMSLESYLEEAAPEISDEDLRAVLASTIVKVSGDGRTIIFNQDMAKSLVLQLDKAQVVSAPAPNGLNLYYSAPETVTLEWNGVSELPEGVTLVGYIYGNVIKPTPDGGKTVPVYWPSSESCVEIELPKGDYALGCGTAAMSPDGRRILVNGSGYDRMFLGIYNTDTNTLEEIRLPEKTQTVTGYAVTDNGGVFFNVKNKDWESVNYYYSCESGSMMSLESYLEEAAPEISDEDLRAVLASTIVKVSGDGRTIIFNQDMAKSLVLQLDKAQVVSAPAPNGLNLYYSAPETVTLEWNGVSELPEGVTLVGYQAYIDGEPLGDVVETTQAGGLHSISGVAEMGRNHSATVRTLYMHEGEEKMSSEADPVETYVSAITALIEFDNFDDSSIDPNGNIMAANDHWTTEIIEDNMLVISWHLDVRDWDNNNPFATVLSAADSPWANAYVSHYRGASDADDFFLSFYTQIKEVNELGQDRSTDFLDVQYTLDGKNWETIETICAADMDHAKWIFHKVDLGDKLAGKIFRLRFNAHGEGKAQLMWALDCIGINDVTDAPQPTGLRAEKMSEGNISLTWQNTMGAWDLSHVINSYVEYSRAIGNEAAGLMAAVDMDSDRIRSHAGEYISGVSAFIYDAPEMEYTPTEAEAVIFEDGVEVARGRFCHSFDKVISSTAWLDSPVLIQGCSGYSGA